MLSDLTPEERAYHDALADAVDMGVYGEEALRYADHMRGTLWFALRALHYAGADVGRAFKTEADDIGSRLRAFFSRP